jgi:hypothetical protein
VLGSSANTLNALSVNIGTGHGHGPFGPVTGPVKSWSGSQGSGQPVGHGRH